MDALTAQLTTKLQIVRALCERGNLPQARATLAELEQLDRRHPLTGFARAHLWLAHQQPEEAIKALEQALSADGNFFDAWLLLGQLQAQQRRYTPALLALNQAQRLHPLNVQTLRLLIGLLQLTGDIPSVTACLQLLLDPALERQPAFRQLPPASQEALLACRMQWEAIWIMNGFSWYGVPQRDLQSGLKGFGQRHLKDFRPLLAGHGHLLRDPDKPLRIGYVSSEWHGPYLQHVYFAAWQHHDSERFVQIAYLDQADVRLPDALADSFSEARPIFGFDELTFYGQVQADRIDVLVDLSGLFNARRLSSFALRPAPVQINAGSNPPFSLALDSFDAMFSDPLLTPPELAALYLEPVCYVSSFLHWQRPDSEPPDLSGRAGQTEIRLGAGASPNKLSDQALRLWGRVLAHLPTAQLTLKNQTYRDSGVCERLRLRFAALGGDAARLKFEDNQVREDLISFFADQDLILDATPYGGALSVCDAFWAGVPMLGLAGGPRIADAVYHCLASEDLLAGSEADYLERAVRLCQDHEYRQQLGAKLRERLLTSAACDPQSYIRELEGHYRSLWQAWLG